jgi:hypothetical protein
MSVRDQAKIHLAANQWQEAVDLLMPLWNSPQREVGDAMYLTKALRKIGRSQEGLGIAREGARMLAKGEGVGTWKPDKLKLALYGLAAWCVYDTEVCNNEAAAILERAARTIRRTLEQSGGSLTESRSPYIRAAFKAAKAVTKGGHARNALDLLGPLSPDVLDTTRTTLPNGKESVTDRERWYLLMSSAMEKEQAWDDILRLWDRATADNTLNEGSLFYLEYRRGCSLQALGRVEEAVQVLGGLAAKKREWWVLQKLATAKWMLNRRRSAMADAALGLLSSDLNEMTGKFVLLIGEWAADEKQTHLASLARRFVEGTWEAQGWPIKAEMRQRLENLPPENGLADLALSEVGKRLRASLWQELDRVDPPLEGIVQKLIGNGKAAFLRIDGRPSVYARLPRGTNFREGMRVQCRIVASFDRKKQQASEEAIHLRSH